MRLSYLHKFNKMSGWAILVASWCGVYVPSALAAPPPLNFTVTMSEAVTVNTVGGIPSITINVGGLTRTANYVGGSGTANLTFSYAPTIGDIDLDGITIPSPVLTPNGGIITDLNGNPESNFSFTAPNLSNVKVDYPSLSMDFTNGTTGRYTLNGNAHTTLASFLGATGGSFTRASIATYFDSTGTLQTAVTNAPRLGYDPITSSYKGLLLEEARTNYVRDSQYTGLSIGESTSNSYWFLSPSAIAGANTSIVGKGTINGMPYVDVRYNIPTNTTGSTQWPGFGTLRTDSIPVNNGTKTIASAWLGVTSYTATGGTCTVGFSNRSYTAADAYINEATANYTSVTPFTYRTTPVMTHGATAAKSYITIYVTTPNGVACDVTIRVAALQHEIGPFPTSYIPTTGTIASRSVENLTMPAGSWFNAAEGSLATSITPSALFPSPYYPQIALFGDGTLNNFIAYTIFAPVNDFVMEWKQAATTIYSLTPGVANSGSTNKFSGGYQNASSAVTKNGGAVVSSAAALSTSLPITQFSIGSNLARGGTDGRYTGFIGSLKYYPLRVSNTQLSLLSQ